MKTNKRFEIEYKGNKYTLWMDKLPPIGVGLYIEIINSPKYEFDESYDWVMDDKTPFLKVFKFSKEKTVFRGFIGEIKENSNNVLSIVVKPLSLS